jgi:hypothetical protein
MARALTPGRTIAVGLLCAVAATVSVWSGPLASASSALHSSGATPTHVALHGGSESGHTVR